MTSRTNWIVPACLAAAGLAGSAWAAVAGAAASEPSQELAIAAAPFKFTFDPVAPAALADSEVWRFDLTTWIWAAGINGDIGAKGVTTNVDASFTDILDAADNLIGIAGRLEVGKGKWAGFVDGIYMKVGVDNVTGPLGLASIDITTKMGIVDFGVMYRLVEGTEDQSRKSEPRASTFDVYAGARYTTLTVELDPANFSPIEGDRDWFDPIVGAKYVAPIGDSWQFATWGDVGGFGVASEFTWSATAIIGYGFKLFDHPVSVFGGYRAIGWDYTDGSGSEKFTWDVVMHGPILGFKLFF